MVPKVISKGSVFAGCSFKRRQTYQKFGNMETLRVAQNQYESVCPCVRNNGVRMKLLYLEMDSFMSSDTVEICKRRVSQTELQTDCSFEN